MKKTKISKILLGWIISLSLFLMTSCEKDLYENGFKNENPKEISIKKIPTKLIKQKEIIDKLKQADNAYKKFSSSKIINDSLLGITIDTDEALVIEKPNYISYTFPILKEGNNLENLVIVSNNNVIKTYIISYQNNYQNASSGLAQNTNVNEVNFNSNTPFDKVYYNTTSTTLLYSGTDGTIMQYCNQTWESNAEYGYMDVANPSTGSANDELISTDCYYVYNFGGGGSGGNSNSDGTGNNGGSVGTGDNSNEDGLSLGDNDEISTSPIDLSPENIRKKNFIKNYLTTSQISWLNLHGDVLSSMTNYLESINNEELSNNYQLDNINYIINIINEIINNSSVFSNSNLNYIVPNNSSNSIPNRSNYFKCFNTSLPASLTIYVDQPIPNSSDPYTGNPILNNVDVGHTFIGITQGGVRRVFGFYPANGVSPIDIDDTSMLVNDSGHHYDVALTIPINSNQLNSIINYCINNFPQTYNLNNFNCTDFGIKIFNFGGVNFPSSYGNWPGGGGDNPGQLGQNIRTMSIPANFIKNQTGGSAAGNVGTCN